jgi:hypothetical protein
VFVIRGSKGIHLRARSVVTSFWACPGSQDRPVMLSSMSGDLQSGEAPGVNAHMARKPLGRDYRGCARPSSDPTVPRQAMAYWRELNMRFSLSECERPLSPVCNGIRAEWRIQSNRYSMGTRTRGGTSRQNVF